MTVLFLLFYQEESGNFIGFFKSIWVLSLGVLLLALVLLWAAAKVKRSNERKTKEAEKYLLTQDLLRDIGIAFFVAAAVTIVYGGVLDFRKVSDLFSLVIGSEVRPEVLETTKSEVFKRDIIREDAELRYVVELDPTLPAGQAIIRAEIGYDVYSLKTEGDDDFQFVQELEHNNIKGKDKDQRPLPRFDGVTVGNRQYKSDELAGMTVNGLLTLKEKYPINYWPGRDADPLSKEKSRLRIVAKRSEIIYVPGSYNIVLSEMTSRVKLHIETPPGIKYTLKKWFDRRGSDFKEEGEYFRFLGITLPGQSVSVQFEKDDGNTSTVSATAAPSPAPAKSPHP